MDMRERHVLFGAVVANAACRLRRQAQKRFDRGRSLRACLEFQQLTEKREGNDDGGGFEVDANAAMGSKRIGK